MEFRMYGGEGDAMVEGVETFKYLGRPLDQTYNNLPAIRRNIMHERMVWGRLGKLLRQEGADHRGAKIFYREVSQAVIFFSWRLGYLWRK